MRDAVDLVSIVQRYAPLGPLVWAATAKSPNENPLQMIQNIRNRALGYSDEQIRAVRTEEGFAVTRNFLREIVGPALDRAEEYCEDVAPTEYLNCLLVDSCDLPVEADADAIFQRTARAIQMRNFTMPNIVNGD